jgi:hypothetical protein
MNSALKRPVLPFLNTRADFRLHAALAGQTRSARCLLRVSDYLCFGLRVAGNERQEADDAGGCDGYERHA